MRLPGSVLFACNHNAIRSPMAAALLRHLHGRQIFVDSDGVRASAIDPFAIARCRRLLEFWPSLDPTVVEGNRAEILEAYRGVRDGLWRRVQDRFPAGPQAQV